MTSVTELGLASRDERPLIAAGDAVFTRGQVRARADRIAEALAQGGVARALVASDDPVVLLAAIEASVRASTDLFVAHTALPAATLSDIAARHGIQRRIGGGGVSAMEGAVTPGAPGEGRIHMMTSGTTGHPKIAAHTLGSLLGRVRKAASAEASRDGRWLLTYVPTGFAGMQVTLTAALSGGLLVVPSERTPSGFLSAATRFQVTHVSATPTFFRSLLMSGRAGTIPLRQITLGAEGVDQSTLDRVARVFPSARITHTYASTEAGVVFAVHDGREGFPRAYLDAPVQGVELRIEDGFLHVRTPNAMRGYVTEGDDPRRADGWLATADRCEIVGDRVRFLGRGDSTINLGLEVVREARVYGVPNPVSGALVGADVVLEAGADADTARAAILERCREALPRYEVPRVFRVVDAIQVGASGKKS
jgi:acyl-coenzyme A synthetase/AMP-(fatty) acid ligase